MSHKKIYYIFSDFFRKLTKDVIEWYPNGLNSIRVRTKETDYVFTFVSEENWKLETVESYISGMKGGDNK